MGKKPYFYHFFWKKEVKLEKIQKKLLQTSTADHDLFFQISHIWPTFIFGVSNALDTFFFYFFWVKQVK